MTEEPAKPKTPRKKKWVGLTESEVSFILHRHWRNLDDLRYADEERSLIKYVQNALMEKNT